MVVLLFHNNFGINSSVGDYNSIHSDKNREILGEVNKDDVSLINSNT